MAVQGGEPEAQSLAPSHGRTCENLRHHPGSGPCPAALEPPVEAKEGTLAARPREPPSCSRLYGSPLTGAPA